jgi:transcription antitermination factor NusG
VTPETEVPTGALVEITAGSFQGLCGKVVRRGEQTRLVIEVEFLRRGVSVEVEEWALRVLSPAAPVIKSA